MSDRALVVLSGGQDSTTCLFWAKQQYGEVSALTFDYDQRHSREIGASIRIAELAGIKNHEVLQLGPVLNGRSPLTNPGTPLETYKNYAEMDKIIGDRVELTFVPMRNSLFLTLAANRAICLDTYDIVTGVCEADNANYPDCRASFIKSQQEAINEALGLHDMSRIVIQTPLIHMSKENSVRRALAMPGCFQALAYSHTAYDGSYPPTSKDHASTLRAHGFEEAWLPDPLVVRAYWEGLMDLPNTVNYLDWLDTINDWLPIPPTNTPEQILANLFALETDLRNGIK